MQNVENAFLQVMEEFFGEKNIFQSMISLMNNLSDYDSDALCQVPVILLSEDVQVNLVDSGFMPFASQVMMIPFSKMNRRQLHSLHNLYQAAELSKSLTADSMMRQGVFVQLSQNRYRVDATLVLYNVHQLICGGYRESVRFDKSMPVWNHVASVLKARIVDSVLLPQEVLQKAQKMIANSHRRRSHAKV